MQICLVVFTILSILGIIPRLECSNAFQMTDTDKGSQDRDATLHVIENPFGKAAYTHEVGILVKATYE